MGQKLPIGVEDFKKMIDQNYFYVDKTDFIAETFNDEVTLYTRPRRFGKSLNMSMLKYFYSIKESGNAYLFHGLKISQIEDAKKYQNQFPVISLSLKDMGRTTFSSSLSTLSYRIAEIAISFPELLLSKKISLEEKKKLRAYRQEDVGKELLSDFPRFLSICLHKHYGKRVILLIDEYDVPLNSAFQNGFYDEMVDFLRSFLGGVLKTNEALEKTILTGCLRISRESIFTGLNNFRINTVMNNRASAAFGFTQEEVNRMYKIHHQQEQLFAVKRWYDGYRFGQSEIYNPWSVIQYLADVLSGEQTTPVSYWANSSSNAIILRYLEQADEEMLQDFQRLVQGQSIVKWLKMDLTYKEMENSSNIYSFLLLTGYLKVIRRINQDEYELMIPNLEVKTIYENHFRNYFQELKDHIKKDLMYALEAEDENRARKFLEVLLDRYISFHDSQESFYHGFLLGALSGLGWKLESNREFGDGRSDITLSSRFKDTIIVIECKKSQKRSHMEKDAQMAVEQIQNRRYLKNEATESFSNRIGYGISFYSKNCHVKKYTEPPAVKEI